MRAATTHRAGTTLFTFTALKCAILRYLMYRSYGPDTTCEREESGTSTVDRYGTQGGPPGRMILAQ